MINKDLGNDPVYEPLLRLSHQAGRITAKTLIFIMNCFSPENFVFLEEIRNRKCRAHRRRTRESLLEKTGSRDTFAGRHRPSKAATVPMPEVPMVSTIESKSDVATRKIVPEIPPVIHVKAAKLKADFQDLTKEGGHYLLIFVSSQRVSVGTSIRMEFDIEGKKSIFPPITGKIVRTRILEDKKMYEFSVRVSVSGSGCTFLKENGKYLTKQHSSHASEDG